MTDVEQDQAEVAEVVRQFIENYDYYHETLGQLSLHFEESADVRLIPGYNFGHNDIEEGEDGQVKIDCRGFTLGLYTNEGRETYYANWYGPDVGDYGEMPDSAEIVRPEEVEND